MYFRVLRTEPRAESDGAVGRPNLLGGPPVVGSRHRQDSGRSDCPSGAAADRLSNPLTIRRKPFEILPFHSPFLRPFGRLYYISSCSQPEHRGAQGGHFQDAVPGVRPQKWTRSSNLADRWTGSAPPRCPATLPVGGGQFPGKGAMRLLADEMGLGKTVQATIALRLALKEVGCDRVLIVAPAALTLNWEREMARWAPDLTVRRLQGSRLDREACYQLPIPVVVGSYEQIRLDSSQLDAGTHFDIVVLDEAQRIKNAESETAFACRQLPFGKAWALTGTPVENSVSDLVSIFRFLNPALLHTGMSRTEIHSRIRPFFLRRRKAEVLPDLPPIIIQDLPLELTGLQREAYDAAWDGRRTFLHGNGEETSDGSIFALITRLKQLCNYEPQSNESVKLESLRVIVESFTERGDKLLVFSQYVEALHWLSARLGDLPHDLYHGQMPEAARDRALHALRAGVRTAGAPRVTAGRWGWAEPAQRLHRGHVRSLVESRGGEPGYPASTSVRAGQTVAGCTVPGCRFHRGADRHAPPGEAGDLRGVRRAGGECDGPGLLPKRAAPNS